MNRELTPMEIIAKTLEILREQVEEANQVIKIIGDEGFDRYDVLMMATAYLRKWKLR